MQSCCLRKSKNFTEYWQLYLLCTLIGCWRSSHWLKHRSTVTSCPQCSLTFMLRSKSDLMWPYQSAVWSFWIGLPVSYTFSTGGGIWTTFWSIMTRSHMPFMSSGYSPLSVFSLSCLRQWLVFILPHMACRNCQLNLSPHIAYTTLTQKGVWLLAI